MEGHEGHMMPGHDMSSMSGHDMGGHDMPGHDMPAMCAMNMLFNWQVKDVCIVFEWWHIHTAIDMLLSCLAVFCIAAGYEFLRVYSSSLDDQRSFSDKKKMLAAEEEIESTEGIGSTLLRKPSNCRSHRQEIVRSLIYTALVAISFWLMLVFMTYNCFLMLSTVLGAGFGHFFFGNGKLKASRDIQCH